MIDFDNGTWSLGTYIGLPFLAIAILLTLWSLVCLVRSVLGDHDAEGIILLSVPTVVGLMIVGFGVACYYPFKTDFHKWYPVTGTVAEAPERRIISSGNSMSERIVIRLKESDMLFGVDDTRAASLKAGDTVSLKCKKEFVYQSAPGWACNWNR